MDPDFHLLSESERKHADEKRTREWRKGSEVKMVVDGRAPLTPQYSCLLYTSPSPRDRQKSRMPSSA